MKSHAKHVAAIFLLTAMAAQAQVPQPQWQTNGTVQYVCGGVSAEGMGAIKALRNGAVGELLFTAGPEGAYLADIAVTVRGGNLREPVSFMSSGPLCLLKLPQGSYTIDATFRRVPLKQTLTVDGTPKQLKFNWPAS